MGVFFGATQAPQPPLRDYYTQEAQRRGWIRQSTALREIMTASTRHGLQVGPLVPQKGRLAGPGSFRA